METLKLKRAGNSVDQIARLRNFARGTIEGHLAECVLEGAMEVTEMVDEKKIAAIESAIKIHGPHMLRLLKESLGEEYSYGEIRAVANHLKRAQLVR